MTITNIIIHNLLSFVHRNQGSSFVSPASGWVGQGRLKNKNSRRQKNFRAKPKAGWGWESVSAIPASAGRQNRKIFVSLIEKEFCARPLKEKEIFAGLVSACGGASRWGGFLPVRAEILAQNGFALRPVIAI